MARQTFTKGQTVYCHRGGTMYRKAIVMRPDMVKKGLRTHYVGVRYINDKGRPGGHEWPITNRANLILTEEAFNQKNRAKLVARLHGDMRAYDKFERAFQPYFDQAKIILLNAMNTVGVANVDPDEVRELAHYLRGMFTFTSSYGQLTRSEVRTLRADKRGEANHAKRQLETMGEEAPELAEEAGAGV